MKFLIKVVVAGVGVHLVNQYLSRKDVKDRIAEAVGPMIEAARPAVMTFRAQLAEQIVAAQAAAKQQGGQL